MKVKVITQVEVPDGATHYHGDILDTPTFFKCTQVGGFDHWWYYAHGWLLFGHSPPNWMKELTAKIDIRRQ